MKTDDRILIFDDLERCGFPIEDVFGYINSFVEHQGLKVVIVANEEELNNIEKSLKPSCPNYNRIKEKLIGKTFRVSLDINSAFDSFLNEVKDPITKEFIKTNKEKVIEIFNLANYKNLRHLKQSIWDFERLYLEIPEKYKNVADLMVDIVSLFLCFSFEVKAGKIMPSQIMDLTSISVGKLVQKKGEDYKPTPMEEVVDKYVFLNPHDTILTEKCWRELFDKGYISRDELGDSLEKSRYFQDETTPDWVKLWHFRDSDDDKFLSDLSKVETQWNAKMFKIPGEILHISGLYLALSELGLYGKNKEEIVTDSKEYINEIKKSGGWSAFGRKYIDFADSDGWGGLGYAGHELDEFREISLYLQEEMKEAQTESLPDAGRNLLYILSQDVRKFRRMITLSESEEQIYYDIPIFKYIGPTEFLAELISLKNSEKKFVAYALRDRYKFPEIASRLIEEVDFLKSLELQMGMEINKRIGKVSAYALQVIKDGYLHEAINQLEKLRKK